jgi:hypothetical protein
MKKILAIFLYVVVTAIFCGNAFALDTYIPHITTGGNDWTDYLQVNNNASSTATFILTLYGSTGAQIYSHSHSVGGHSRSQIELKALNSSAATGKITYTDAGLVFRVSYESLAGGVAEFKTIDTLGSNIGFYFSDFTTLVQWKGAAIANMGTTSAGVTFYALGGSSGGSGGSILATHTETIAPKAKLIGNNLNFSWLSGLDLNNIESIVAVTDSSSLCGIAISGDMALSRLLFTPATPVSYAQCLYVIAPSVSTSMEAGSIMASNGWARCKIKTSNAILVVVRSMLFDPLNYSYESVFELQEDADMQLNIVGQNFHIYIYSVDDDLRVTQLSHASYKAD